MSNHDENERETPETNPPLPDPGSYDGEHGEGIETPEEQPGVGN